MAEMTDRDLQQIFWWYDQIFLGGEIGQYFSEPHEVPTSLEIKLDRFGRSGQLKNLGTHGEQIDTAGISGHCQVSVGPDDIQHTLLISRPILGHLFTHERGSRNFAETTNGLQCQDQLMCLLITLEHEIGHLIINIWCRSNDDAHGSHFMTLVNHIFGHTEPTHSLGRGLSEAATTHIEKVRQYVRPGLEVRLYDPWDNQVATYVVDQVDPELIVYNPRDDSYYPRSWLDVLLPDEFLGLA